MTSVSKPAEYSVPGTERSRCPARCERLRCRNDPADISGPSTERPVSDRCSRCRRLQRDAHRKCAAATRSFTLNFNGPIVLRDDLMADEQTQSRAFADAAEFEQILRDVLAAKRLGLNHTQILLDGFAFVRITARDVVQAALQPFGAEGDAGQGIVDLVGHAGGEKADADQSFGPHQLAA